MGEEKQNRIHKLEGKELKHQTPSVRCAAGELGHTGGEFLNVQPWQLRGTQKSKRILKGKLQRKKKKAHGRPLHRLCLGEGLGQP